LVDPELINEIFSAQPPAGLQTVETAAQSSYKQNNLRFRNGLRFM
jgi:hypothetical protein